jgi:hypothetical protein
MADFTYPRQVRLIKCALLAPGLRQRGATPDDSRQLDVYGFDIVTYVQRIDIYESIFDNTLSGSITLLENIGLTELLPIVGVETLSIVFSVEDSNGDTKTFQRSFRITKVHDATFPRHEWRLYTMEFVTNEFIISMSRRICRPFKGQTCQQHVNDILKNDLKVKDDRIITNEPTFDKVNVLVPNYAPLKAINYFTILSQTESKESNFLFFETLDGFHFTSIRKLIADATGELKKFEANPGLISGAPIVADDVVRNSVLRIQQEQTFDLLHDIADGTLRARMVHFDILARKQEHSDDSRYSDTFNTTTHLDKYPVYPKNFERSIGKDVRLFTVPSNAWTANSSYLKAKQEDTTEQRLRESIVLRNRQLREIRHIQTLVDAPGQPDLRAGSVVIVNYPSTRALRNADVSINVPVLSDGTPYHSGKHLVTSVHHILASIGGDRMDYRMNMRVCRDSLGAPLIGTSSTKDT